ncbi:uncharacterized protein LOC131671726 isoform X4 [Phymastichus coffea]|nr:uncharacterized protein LOC131671726 isoform X4 [Phymastichus coffea]
MDIISVGLQKSLVATQHKLWMAIKEHQKCSQKLSGNPNDPQDKHLQARMKMIEIKILEIDRWQKDLYCQLRKEIAALNSETALHETKLWLAEALQLNNNHIIRNGSNASLVNGHASSSSNVSEDEEPPPPPQQNGVTASPFEGQHSPTSFKQGREASTSGSADEEAECSPEALSEEETPGASLAVEAENKKCFLGRIGLISHERLGEIERRRNQRKRRSNVRSQFLYSAPQPPQKRKRYAYLQSGNAPQTRQTTARLNGPSPTPTTKSTGRGSGSSKQSTSSKPLIQPAKTAAATGGSVMRNGEVTKHKEFSIKQKTDNGNGTMKISSTGKTVHIPGLPSSLTVEWIDKDSTVCVSCRNPGSLTMCEACAAKFHVSCHTTSPVSTSHCPKCVTRFPVKAIGSGNDLEILRHEVKHVKKEYRDKEEREKLRERNADLRFQLSELEKRSQLISQSLQEQQVNRHELTAKEERTRSCIKRLVNFIRLMQLRPGNSSSSPSLPSTSSSSCPPRPSSYPSPALPSLSPQRQRHHMMTTIPISDPTLGSATTWPKLSGNFPRLALPPEQHRETNGEDWRSNPRDSYKDDQVMRVPQSIQNNQYPYCTTKGLMELPEVRQASDINISDIHMYDDFRMSRPRPWTGSSCPSPPSPRPLSPAIMSLSRSPAATTITEPTTLPAKILPMATLCPKAPTEFQTSSTWNHNRESKSLHGKNLK